MTQRAFLGATGGRLAMKPSCRRVLERLRQGPATTAELLQPELGGARFGARIQDLRDMGFRIASDRERQSSSRYTLTFDLERDATERAGGITNPVPRESTATFVESQPQAVGAASLFDPTAFERRGGYRDAA